MVSSLLRGILDSLSFWKVEIKFKMERSSSFNYEVSAVTILTYVLEVLSQTNFLNIKNVSVIKLV